MENTLKIKWIVMAQDMKHPAAQFSEAPDASSIANTLGDWFRDSHVWAPIEFSVLRLDERTGLWEHYADFMASPPRAGAIIKGFPIVPQKYK